MQTLYHELIIDHSQSPKHFYKLHDATADAQGFNPLCGDKVHVFLKVEDNKIVKASFEGQGCAISIAASSLMTEQLLGKTIEEAEQLFQDFKNWLLNPQDTEDANPCVLGKLLAFSGVRKFPSRIKCATLPWHTLSAALKAEIECTK